MCIVMSRIPPSLEPALTSSPSIRFRRLSFCTLLAIGGVLPLLANAQGVAVEGVTAQAPGARLKAGELTVTAKVVELDAARRSVVLRGPKGNLVTVDVPPEVKNFDQVRVGDELVIRYAAAVAAALEPASKSGIRERIESTSTAAAAPGALPGMATARRVEILAEIQAVDRKARTATLRGAKRTVVVAVPENIDIAKLKVGGDVHAVFVEAMVIDFEHAKPAK